MIESQLFSESETGRLWKLRRLASSQPVWCIQRMSPSAMSSCLHSPWLHAHPRQQARRLFEIYLGSLRRIQSHTSLRVLADSQSTVRCPLHFRGIPSVHCPRVAIYAGTSLPPCRTKEDLHPTTPPACPSQRLDRTGQRSGSTRSIQCPFSSLPRRRGDSAQDDRPHCRVATHL